MKSKSFLEKRKEECSNRLNSVELGIKKNSTIKRVKDICIYVTGSYARMEANKYSDLDIFLIKEGNHKKNSSSNLDEILVRAELIKITREMNFTEFSNDGQYLVIHNIENILDELGCPSDDYYNYFTARMLLLLESRPIYNKQLYHRSIERIINTYFRDYHDHDKEFRPIFLVNDIMRYYKTMCLNYEHKRNRKTDDVKEKNKAHLKNLKLKFSRLLTCYATIFVLIQKKHVTPKDLLKIVSKTPIEKIKMIKLRNKKIIQEILDEYAWFLQLTNNSPKSIIDWIGEKSNRDNAFKRGRIFHRKMYSLLMQIANESDLMYLTM